MAEEFMQKRTDRCIASERLCDTGFSYTLSPHQRKV